MSIPTTTSPLAALRERLIALEYHRPIHETYLGSARGTAAERLEQALEYASGDRPLAVAMRLFLVGVPVEAAHAAGALGEVHALVGRQHAIFGIDPEIVKIAVRAADDDRLMIGKEKF